MRFRLIKLTVDGDDREVTRQFTLTISNTQTNRDICITKLFISVYETRDANKACFSFINYIIVRCIFVAVL